MTVLANSSTRFLMIWSSHRWFPVLRYGDTRILFVIRQLWTQKNSVCSLALLQTFGNITWALLPSAEASALDKGTLLSRCCMTSLARLLSKINSHQHVFCMCVKFYVSFFVRPRTVPSITQLNLLILWLQEHHFLGTLFFKTYKSHTRKSSGTKNLLQFSTRSRVV